MKGDKQVKEMMINIFDYPHVPYWFSIGQAIHLIKMSFAGHSDRPDPIALLVFDEKYNLVGTVNRHDLLRALGPENWRSVPELPDQQAALSDDSLSGDFISEAKHKVERPVSEVMVPVRYFVEPDDLVTRAAFLMVRHKRLLLPVLEGKKKFVGLIRMADVFDHLSEVVD
jgi:CBS domain-containing protein